MTASITNRPAPQWLRDLAHGRAAYEELFGWAVTVQVSDRRLVLAVGSSVSAVTMPVTLGTLVRDELGVAMQHVPVLSDPGGLNWTFLTRPPEELRGGVHAELSAADVAFTPHGGHVVLPTSPEERPVIRTWQWVDPPAPGRALPPAYPVIAVTRRLTAHRPLALGA
jgi:hypothetical protein